MRSGLPAAVATVALLFVVGGCASKAPQWKTGVSWKDLSYESLKDLHDAGIDSIEVTVADVMKTPAAQRPEKCRQIVADAQKAGITLWSGHIPFGRTWDISTADPQQRQQVLAKVREAMEVCAMLKLQKAVIHASAEPIKEQERAARLAVAKESLRQLTPQFAQHRIQLALEDLPRTCLGNASEEILWLIQGIDGLGVCFDTNHLLKEKPEEFARKVGPHIVTLHVSDYDGVDERHWMAGDGIINWNAVTAALRQANYSGPFLFETGKHKDGTTLKPEEMVKFAKKV
jgi:sugar phosphate isomerase/epimerase